MNNPLMHVTFSRSPYDNRVDPIGCIDLYWEELVEQFNDHSIVKKKDESPLISPVKFKTIEETTIYAEYTESEASRGWGKEGELKLDTEGNPFTWKGAVNIKEWFMLPVDIDEGFTIVDAIKKYKDYEYILYTSFSHQTGDVPKDKFRILFPLFRPVSAKDFEYRRHSIAEWLGAASYDESSLARFRGFYLPSCTKENYNNGVIYHNEGQLLDLYDFEEFIEPEWVPPVRPEERNKDMDSKILELLTTIDTLEYPIWFNVCCAMKFHGFDYSDFEYVSHYLRAHRTSSDFKSTWKRANGRSTKQATMGTIVNLLKSKLGADCLGTKVKEVNGMKSGRAVQYNRWKKIKG